MELEGVWSVSVRSVPFEILGQIDNVDGLEGAFLNAYAAPDAQRLRKVCNLGFGRHLDAQLAKLDDWAGLFAFLATLFGLAFLGAYDGNARQVVAGGVGLLGHLLLWWHNLCGTYAVMHGE